MNDSFHEAHAQFPLDLHVYGWLISIKFVLAVCGLPLLISARNYRIKVLVHESFSLLMRFHYFYIVLLTASCTIDFLFTLYSFHAGNVEMLVISSTEIFLRRYPQLIGVYGTFSSMFMMSVERFIASKNFRTYESSRRNGVYFWVHLAIISVMIPPSVLSYQFGTTYSQSTIVPERGHEYHQAIAVPITLTEWITLFFFEYLLQLNRARVCNVGFSLTERYQIAENIRSLELLRPLARFHGFLTCLGAIGFLLIGQKMENEPAYPIFEESINLLQLQSILLPLLIMRHERRERSRRALELEKNSSKNRDFIARYNVEIMKGW